MQYEVGAVARLDGGVRIAEGREFREMDPAALEGVVAQKRIIDARNALDPARWRAAGWTYGSLGRP